MDKIANIKTLYEFSVSQPLEVDEVVTKEQDGKIITETTKVTKSVPTFFAIKRPSRLERERAEEERAIWWSKYFDMGIKTEATILKTYANDGGILSNTQKMQYNKDKSDLLAKMEEYEMLKVLHIADKDKLDQARLNIVLLRDKLLRFEQDQATFFENTCESKARVKLAEWLLMNLSYWRASEDKPWEQYFHGNNEQKFALLEKKEEENDKIYLLAQPQLYFIVSFLISSNFTAKKEDIDNYLSDPE